MAATLILAVAVTVGSYCLGFVERGGDPEQMAHVAIADDPQDTATESGLSPGLPESETVDPPFAALPEPGLSEMSDHRVAGLELKLPILLKQSDQILVNPDLGLMKTEFYTAMDGADAYGVARHVYHSADKISLKDSTAGVIRLLQNDKAISGFISSQYRFYVEGMAGRVIAMSYVKSDRRTIHYTLLFKFRKEMWNVTVVGEGEARMATLCHNVFRSIKRVTPEALEGSL